MNKSRYFILELIILGVVLGAITGLFPESKDYLIYITAGLCYVHIREHK